ncbi:MAG TPA: translation initiation factor 2 [Rugosimonospora sp.]
MNDDLQWRRPPGAETGRPAGSGDSTPGRAPQGDPQPPYAGPPRTTPPPADWRPRTLIQTPPPRPMPRQDAKELDAREREARTVTYGVGMVAGAVLLIVLFVLCGRALF